MSGYLLTGDKTECFGCGACFQICPTQAIKMTVDNEGFLYPSLNSLKCVKCNSCHKACPMENMPLKEHIKIAVAGYDPNPSVRKNSASGGAFSTILDAADSDTVVFGVEWEDRSKAGHVAANVDEASLRFRKSKYIQSNTNFVYKEVKRELLIGKNVIFVGTPCQIAGLKAFLHYDYDRLLSVDIVCHGVPSGKVLEKYLLSQDRKNNPIIRIDFREKIKQGSRIDSKCAVLHYEHGQKKVIDYDSSGFLRGFANGLFFRPSCSVCKFACSERIADLTMGDAWGIERIKPEMNPHMGVSLVFANTEKGVQWTKQILKGDTWFEMDADDLVAGNGRLNSPDRGHEKREIFFNQIDDTDFEKLIKSLIPRISAIRKIGSKVKHWIRG